MLMSESTLRSSVFPDSELEWKDQIDTVSFSRSQCHASCGQFVCLGDMGGHQAELCLLSKGSEVLDLVLKGGIVHVVLLVGVCWLAAGLCVGVRHVGCWSELDWVGLVWFGVVGRMGKQRMY